MPELPEVESVVRHLKPRIVGKKIQSAWSNTPRLFRHGENFNALKKDILGKTILDVGRTGKNILITLSDGVVMRVHLMMTGGLLLNPPSAEPHIRFYVDFADGERMAFSDIRKFGMIDIVQRLSVGADALSVSLAEFKKVFVGRRVNIKSALLNQAIISGIGNIYSDEILWHASVHPTRTIDSLSHTEVRAIHLSMKKVLQLAIKKQGTSSRDYRMPDGSEGGYYDIRKAYQRTDEPCGQKDGGIIQRMVIGQRSSHFCSVHQI
jgi:formamidopyrimidine-DNA glycosylase